MRHEAGVRSASFSPDGTRVVTGSFDNTVRLWDAATGVPIGQPLRHDDGVRGASFSVDGYRVVTASRDGTARVWDAATGRPSANPSSAGLASIPRRSAPMGRLWSLRPSTGPRGCGTQRPARRSARTSAAVLADRVARQGVGSLYAMRDGRRSCRSGGVCRPRGQRGSPAGRRR